MLQLRYNSWGEEIKKKWGTLGAYLPTLLLFDAQIVPSERELPVEIPPSLGST